MFKDVAEITIKAGNGGNGIVSFLRLKYIPNGGPAGGDGGNGGDVIFKTSQNISTLSGFMHKKNFFAENGEDGKRNKKHGKSGESLIIKVPPGTIIKNKKSGNIVADMAPGSIFIAAKGGRGGFGNYHFAAPNRQAPRFSKSGMLTNKYDLVLELKLIADVGLIGFPNVGKSTLLSIISNTKPKVANYEFTTLIPNLGVVNINDKSFVVADIPGIIKGASHGIGLGIEFLKHIERTKILVHVIDISETGRDPILDFKTINSELSAFNSNIGQKPQIVAINKCDVPRSPGSVETCKLYLENLGYKVVAISGATKFGIKTLLNCISHELSKVSSENNVNTKDDLTEVSCSKIIPEDISIELKNGKHYVFGIKAKMLVNSVNFDDFESVAFFQRAIKNSGIEYRLKKNGVNEGDIVNIHGREFQYHA